MECEEVHSAEELPDDPAWLYEVKWDGCRTIITKHGNNLRFFTRKGNAPACRFEHIADALQKSQAPDLVIDGELVALMSVDPAISATAK